MNTRETSAEDRFGTGFANDLAKALLIVVIVLGHRNGVLEDYVRTVTVHDDLGFHAVYDLEVLLRDDVLRLADGIDAPRVHHDDLIREFRGDVDVVADYDYEDVL
ncbi:MAG: hypothetical protein IKR86_11340, partial [Candidatus Methanomethylophilaceae archaeon]|nr:hypothetical protein [Candidatus Methanomethylophilaceae archaeon]